MRKHLRLSLGMAALIAVGCGGSGTYTFVPPAVAGSTDTPTQVSTQQTTVVAPTTNPVTSNFSVNGSVVQGTIPAGETINAGDSVTLVPLDFPVPVDIDTTSAIKTRQGFVPGEIWISRDGGQSWHDTHLKLQGKKIVGNLGSQYIALVARGQIFDLSVDGPFHLGAGTNRLDISTEMIVHYEKFGVNSYPRRVQYAFPANGGILTQAHIDAYFPTLFDTSGGGQSEVAYGSVDKNLNATIYSDHLTFNDPATDNLDPIPVGGIDFVGFSMDTNTTPRHFHRR